MNNATEFNELENMARPNDELHNFFAQTRYPNGYGASVVRGTATFGGRDGRYEVAVVRFEGEFDTSSALCFSTPLTDGVIGHLTAEEVTTTLQAIAALPEYANGRE